MNAHATMAIGLLAALAAPVGFAAHADEAQLSPTAMVELAMDQLGTQPASAMRLATRAEALLRAAHDGDRGRHFCTRSDAETAAVERDESFGSNGGDDHPLELVGDAWCWANYIIGYSLVDLHRGDEALPWLRTAVDMGPHYAVFINELAEWYKSHRRFDDANALFERADAAAEFSEADNRNSDRARAWRGQAFVLIERGQLDAAEALFRRSLTLDPGNAAATSELAYIAAQRTAAAAAAAAASQPPTQ